MAAIALHQAADADNWLGGAGSCLITVVLLADAVHFAPQARVWGCWSAAERICEIEVVLPLSPVAGRITEPRRDRATASVSPPQSRPTESTTMSGRLPVLSHGIPSARRLGGPGECDCLAVLPPTRSPARASALARTTSGSRGSGGRTSCQGRSRRTPCRWIRIRCTVSHLLGQPPSWVADGGSPALLARLFGNDKGCRPRGASPEGAGQVEYRGAAISHPKVPLDRVERHIRSRPVAARPGVARRSAAHRPGRCCRSCALIGPSGTIAQPAGCLCGKAFARSRRLSSGMHRHAVGRAKGR